MPRLQDRYRETVCPNLIEQFGYANPMQVPRLTKIVLNMGVGRAVADSKVLDSAVGEMAAIAGQKPVVTRARKSIAGFRLREGMAIGCKVTLRRARMWEFLDRLTTIALPRVRDFRGVPARAFDGRGNYSLGIREQIVFPEISYDRVESIRGMNVVVCTTARTDEEARALLAGLNLPFER